MALDTCLVQTVGKDSGKSKPRAEMGGPNLNASKYMNIGTYTSVDDTAWGDTPTVSPIH